MDVDFVKKFVSFSKTEKIIKIYFYDKNDPLFYVLSDEKFVKVEKGKIVSSVCISDITKVEHVSGGIFKWDKLYVRCKENTETFGIYSTDVALDFKKCIENLLENSTKGIYVLECEHGKYYVGKVKHLHTLEKRFKKHSDGQGSEWTKLYKPLRVIETIKNANPFHEDAKVIELMSKYGIYNVRGGSYSKIRLTREQFTNLLNSIRGASDLCFYCGDNKHFINACPLRKY